MDSSVKEIGNRVRLYTENKERVTKNSNAICGGLDGRLDDSKKGANTAGKGLLPLQVKDNASYEDSSRLINQN